jgi:hypothetical protein
MIGTNGNVIESDDLTLCPICFVLLIFFTGDAWPVLRDVFSSIAPKCRSRQFDLVQSTSWILLTLMNLCGWEHDLWQPALSKWRFCSRFPAESNFLFFCVFQSWREHFQRFNHNCLSSTIQIDGICFESSSAFRFVRPLLSNAHSAGDDPGADRSRKKINSAAIVVIYVSLIIQTRPDQTRPMLSHIWVSHHVEFEFSGNCAASWLFCTRWFEMTSENAVHLVTNRTFSLTRELIS